MEKINFYDKIISPMVTEKSTNQSRQNKVVFKIPNKSNKKIIKKNIEKLFKVNVIKVNIVIITVFSFIDSFLRLV